MQTLFDISDRFLSCVLLDPARAVKLLLIPSYKNLIVSIPLVTRFSSYRSLFILGRENTTSTPRTPQLLDHFVRKIMAPATHLLRPNLWDFVALRMILVAFITR